MQKCCFPLRFCAFWSKSLSYWSHLSPSVTLSVTPFRPVRQQVIPRRDRLTDKNTKKTLCSILYAVPPKKHPCLPSGTTQSSPAQRRAVRGMFLSKCYGSIAIAWAGRAFCPADSTLTRMTDLGLTVIGTRSSPDWRGRRKTVRGLNCTALCQHAATLQRHHPHSGLLIGSLHIIHKAVSYLQ